jgi:hypothetical protein
MRINHASWKPCNRAWRLAVFETIIRHSGKSTINGDRVGDTVR